MGQTLSEPVTAKESASCQNSRLKVGSSSMQGWRVSMEDSHTHLLSLPEDPGTSFFGVFDGHGGARVAQYAGRHLHKYVVRRPEYQRGDIEEAIRQGYLEMDQAMRDDEELRDELAGSTAIIVILRGNVLYCGNVGDSRVVASVNGLARALSVDHKPSNEDEAKRIQAAGGWVELNRVNGNLALSRALGDFVFKRNSSLLAEEQIITALPDVQVHQVDDDWEFVLLACDGIWDVMTNQEVVDFIRLRIAGGMEPEVACEELMQVCLAPDTQMGGLGCDNMTVVVVCFQNGKPYAHLAQRCSRPRDGATDSSGSDGEGGGSGEGGME